METIYKEVVAAESEALSHLLPGQIDSNQKKIVN
jgi:hypothetical protein